jgi:hypothetical protein
MVNATVEKIVKLYTGSRNYYKPVRDEWVTDYKQYQSILDIDTTNDYYKWRSKLFIPATARAVDGLLPDLLLTLFGSDPFFEIAPREASDVPQADIQTALLSFQFGNCDFFNKSFTYLKQMAMYGTTFGKVFWKKETAVDNIEIDVPQEDGTTKMVKIPKEEVLFDQPYFEPIDLFSLFVSKSATSLKDTWVIHRDEKSIKEMKEAGVYKNIKELETEILSDKASGKYEEEVRKWTKGLSGAYNDEEGDDRKVELLEYWNLDRTKTMTIAGQRVMVRELRDNPYGSKYDPFVSSSLWTNPFELLGTGVPKKCRDLQAQINSEVNQRLDNRNLRQNVIIKVRRGANINTRNLISRPGGVWLTDDMTALEVVNIPDISSNSSFMEENTLEQKCEEITGVTRYATGSGASGDRTATEASILTKMSSKSFALHLKQLEETFIKPVLRKFLYLNSRFMEREEFVRVTGQSGGYDFIKVTPQDVIKTNYDLVAKGSSELTDKNMKVQQMVNFMGMIAQDPAMQGFKSQLTRRIWEAWGNKDYDVIKQQAEQQMMIAQQQAMQQMMQQQASQQGGQQGIPQGASGQPMEATGMRMPSPQEGSGMMMMGGGGSPLQ